MTQNTPSSCQIDIDTQRLQNWFPVADIAEVSTRLGDRAALVDYLSFCNDLTPSEAAEMLEALATIESHDAAISDLRAA